MSNRLSSLCFTLLGLTALLGACRPDPIDIDLPQQEPRLALSSVLGTVRDTLFGLEDSVLVVTVTRSTGALTSASQNTTDSTQLFSQLVTHARVELLGGGQSFILEPLAEGVYWLPSPPLRPDTPYTLLVSDSATQLTCQATTFYLPQMRFDYVKPTVTRTPTDTTVTLEYQLTDKPGRSFYLVQYTPLSGNAPTGIGEPDAENVGSMLNSLQQEQRMRLLTDNDFHDGRYTLRERLAVRAQDTVLLGVAQISEDYFRFLEAYRKSGKLFNQLTGEPINYPTNVRNGYGFFGLQSIGAQVVDLNRY